MASVNALVNPRQNRQPISHDIEHVQVDDDPREWTKMRKTCILLTIFSASMIAGLNSNLYNPAISQIKLQLQASSAEISLSLSLYILISGCFGVAWSAVSEVYGRKIVYICSFGLSVAGNVAAATAQSIAVLIGMRCLQAVGSSAVISIGAATLADMYDPHERGTFMGLYLCAPLLGPAIGPMIGGLLTQAFDWRATFWFLSAFTGICLLSFVFFKDTFRQERSSAYQAALQLTQERKARRASHFSTFSQATVVEPEVVLDISREKADFYAAEGVGTPEPKSYSLEIHRTVQDDVEAEQTPATAMDTDPRPEIKGTTCKKVKHTLHNMNPVRPIIAVLRRFNNLATSLASGLCFAFGYSLTYTSTRTLSMRYGYDPLHVGLILLAYGAGSATGSVLGGRWSDRVMAKLKATGQRPVPEMRLDSIKYIVCLLPGIVSAYGWLSEKHVHVAALCVTLSFAGFLSMWLYSITLTYIVDANVGRSSTAVATNSCFRGVLAFVAAEVAVPLQDSIGDGGLYSLWAGLLLMATFLTLLVRCKGSRWRATAEQKESSK
ncbi:MFS general substrate transporter [Cristinia sonorae]|uniref:MFS general substrate transporter n=1 Tax=Cristinia sonorae TaxID=1940300 RepID=A0A8K0XK01_9AGAR|nr:MFS general substrate transporter [Cristinia sonorae]